MKFKVTVSATAIVSAEIEVEAEDWKAAEHIAENRINLDAFTGVAWAVDSIEGCVDSVKSEEVK